MVVRPMLVLLGVLLAAGCAKETCPTCPECKLTCPEAKDCPACNCAAAPACPECKLSCPEIPPAPGPALLTTYADLYKALREGRNVRAVLDYEKCTLNGAPGPAAVGAMPIDVFEWFDAGVVGNPRAYLACSSTKLIKLGTNYRYNYAKVRVSDDGAVTVDAEYVTPADFTTAMREVFTCKLSKDAAALEGATFWQL